MKPVPGRRAAHSNVNTEQNAIPDSKPVLGVETSCDETGVAVYDVARGLLAHTLYSQIKMHADYGGVVPELASRDHVRKLLPLIRETLRAAGMSTRDLGGVAYTAGPGLVGALRSGPRQCAAARAALARRSSGATLACSWDNAVRFCPMSACW